MLNMKKILVFFLELTIVLGLNIDDRLILSGNNIVEIGKAISHVPNNQLPGMIWLINNMPEDDLKILSSDFLLTNCDLAYNVWTNSRWGDDIPENIFNACKQFVFSDVTEDLLFIRIEDPGLGIIIPEIDYPKTKKGELIDGVITNKGIHLAKGGK